MEYLSMFETMNDVIGGSDGPTSIFLAGPELQLGMEVLIVSAVISLIIGFFGLKLFRVLSAIEGLGIGAVIGLVIALAAELSGGAFIGVVIGCAVVCAVFLTVFKRIGAFFISFGFAAGALLSLITLFSAEKMLIVIIIALVVSLILAILAAIFVEPLVIIATSIFGGIAAGTAFRGIIGVDGAQWLGYLLVVVCMIVQSMLQSRKVGKKEKQFAKKFKEEASMESEVERARMILDDEDEADKEEFEDSEDDKDIEIEEIDLDEK